MFFSSNQNSSTYIVNRLTFPDGASGGLYAGATAGNGVGATAALGGDTNSGVGYGGAEAHAGGVAKEVTAVKTAGVGVVNVRIEKFIQTMNISKYFFIICFICTHAESCSGRCGDIGRFIIIR